MADAWNWDWQQGGNGKVEWWEAVSANTNTNTTPHALTPATLSPISAHPVHRATAPYDSASTGRRTRSWSRSTDSINALLYSNSESLRAHSRDAVRKTPWASAAIASYTANAIGTGIKPLSQHPDSSVKETIHREFRRWTDSADFDGLTDFYGLQSLAFRSMLESGEALIRLHTLSPADMRGNDRSSMVPLELQLLEPDHLPFDRFMSTIPLDAAPGNDIRYGIEFTPRGKRAAYHLYREHPGELNIFTRDPFSTTRVPASEIIHLFVPLRPGQQRGQVHLSSILLALRDLDEYTDGALIRKKMSTLFAGFVTRSVPDIDPVTGEPISTGITEAEIEAGTLYNLNPGENITFSTTPDDAGFAEFVRTNLRAIAIGAGVTYEQMTGDLEKVNYSSIRAGLLEFRRKCEQIQHHTFIYQFCRRVFREWMRLGMLSGTLNLPYANYSSRREDYMDVKWITPGWPWVDPESDSKAALNDVRGGFTSRSAIVAGKGEDIEEIDREQAADNSRADRLGLPYDSDPRKDLKTIEKQGKVDESKIEKQGEVQKDVDKSKPQPQPAQPLRPRPNGRTN